MREAFVPLDEFLRATSDESAIPVRLEPLREIPLAPCTDEAIRTARRFQAGLADALEGAVQRLLPQIAREILGRELRLQAADIAVIIADALRRYADEPAVSLRVHPDDVERLDGVAIATVADKSLRRGDAMLELHSGTIDLRLESRLETVVGTDA